MSIWSAIEVAPRNPPEMTEAIDTTQESQGVEDETTHRSLMTPRATPKQDSTSHDAVDPPASQYEETPTLENDTIQNETVENDTVNQPRTVRNIGLDLDEANILTGRRVRRPQRHAYAVKRQELHKTQLDNVNNASIYHMAFSIAATFRKARIHSTELPAPPNHWKDMLSHPHKAGFLAAAKREFRDLKSA